MPVKSTRESFIRKAVEVHGGLYDYSAVNYSNSQTDIDIKCKKHGVIFHQRPNNHLNGRTGCPKCALRKFSNSRTIGNKEFIEQAKKTHGNLYDYSLVKYVSWNKKVKILCRKHGVFFQTPLGHKQGQGCPKCKFEKLSNLFRYTLDDFIKKAKLKHGNTYDYSMVSYTRNSNLVKILCKVHGEFEQSPASHFNGAGCPQCAIQKQIEAQSLTQAEFLSKAEEVHGDKFDYSETVYINHINKIKIRCKKHNYTFWQKANNHLNGQGCPLCKQSQGERRIRAYLEKNNIPFTPGKMFQDCKHKRMLPFDFFLPSYNTLIEFDGIQHFIAVDFNNTGDHDYENKFIESKKRDAIKDEYCKKNHIKLIRIAYYDLRNIKSILNKKLTEAL